MPYSYCPENISDDEEALGLADLLESCDQHFLMEKLSGTFLMTNELSAINQPQTVQGSKAAESEDTHMKGMSKSPVREADRILDSGERARETLV